MRVGKAQTQSWWRALASVALACGCLTVACSEEDGTLLGFALVQGAIETTGPFGVQLDSSTLDSYFQTSRRRTATVWVGQQVLPEGVVHSKTLLRFQPSLPDGAALLAATLVLPCDGTGDWGDDQPLVVACEEATAGRWFTDDATTWPFDEHRPFTPPVTAEVHACNNDPELVSARWELPVATAAAWIADPDSANLGIVLAGVSGAVTKRFTIAGTLIEARYAAGTDTTTTQWGLTHHVTLTSIDPAIQSQPRGSEAYALVGSGYDYRALLGFDLSSLPDDATVQRMVLTLAVDPAQTVTDLGADTLAIGLHRVMEAPGETLPSLPEVSFLTQAVTEHTWSATDTTVAIDISQFSVDVRDGILLKHAADFPPRVRLGFYTREAAPTRRPQLAITYTRPALGRL